MLPETLVSPIVDAGAVNPVDGLLIGFFEMTTVLASLV
ncbi:hypothetical protein L963_1571 [Leuconostoc mesenteroides subsp. cremoris T26]|nr:hypothetical protein L963_1571 [Leuconostoc mesenteroides subsp. cremoris T26]